MFRTFDLNGDGVISRQEWVRNFEALDNNRDVRIEQNEIYFQGDNRGSSLSTVQQVIQDLFRKN